MTMQQTLACACRPTDRADFPDAARQSFAYGLKQANGKNGAPKYCQIHSANGAKHGNVFMVVDSAARSR